MALEEFCMWIWFWTADGICLLGSMLSIWSWKMSQDMSTDSSSTLRLWLFLLLRCLLWFSKNEFELKGKKVTEKLLPRTIFCTANLSSKPPSACIAIKISVRHQGMSDSSLIHGLVISAWIWKLCLPITTNERILGFIEKIIPVLDQYFGKPVLKNNRGQYQL